MGLENSLLGKITQYPTSYDAGLLTPISRLESRSALGLQDAIPFAGVDLWTAYELSWLDSQGKPHVRIAEFTIGCDSQNIVESKSLKLYLNSLNNQPFSNEQTLKKTITDDLSRCVKGEVDVNLWALDDYHEAQLSFDGFCLDSLDVRCEALKPQPDLLKSNDKQVSELLYSHLLKTNCPVTGQPDWASVFIQYTGPEIDKEGLLQYLVSYRHHQDFHEHCVESITIDLLESCKPSQLSVYARYTRRGGIDINPYRWVGMQPELSRLRTSRQ